MKKFMHMEDNEDGTMTVTVCVDGENEGSFLLQMSLESLTESMFVGNEALLDAAITISENIIIIPNEV